MKCFGCGEPFSSFTNTDPWDINPPDMFSVIMCINCGYMMGFNKRGLCELSNEEMQIAMMDENIQAAAMKIGKGRVM